MEEQTNVLLDVDFRTVALLAALAMVVVDSKIQSHDYFQRSHIVLMAGITRNSQKELCIGKNTLLLK